jgi:ankyrin repeat protein
MSRHIFDMIRRGQTSELAADIEDNPDLAASRDAQGVSALLWSIYTGQPVIRDFLLTRLPGLDLFEAAAIGDTAQLERLLAADPSAARSYSGDGWTPLHLAAAFASPAAVKVLLAHGADVDALSKNPLSNQPLHAAVSLNTSSEVVTALLDAGADVNAKQAGGFTPLHQAADSGKAEIVAILLARGADRSALCDKAKTAADYARARDRIALADLLSHSTTT